MEQNQQNSNEIEIDLGELFHALWAKKIIIILAGIVFLLAAGVFSKFFMAKKYQSTTEIYVKNQENASNNTLTASDLSSGTQLTKDFQVLIKNREVLEQVLVNLEIDDMNEDQLYNIVTVDVPTDTRMLQITVTHEKPYMARDIADELREVASEKIKDVMGIESVEVATKANMPDAPSSPNVKKNALLGLIAGLALAIFGVLLVYLLDDTIKTQDDVEKYLGVGVLGSIPLTDGAKKSKKKTGRNKIKERRNKK